MKRRKILSFTCFVVLCFLCACNTEKQSSTSNLPPLNCEYGYGNYAVSGEDGYYFLCGELIVYWDGDLNHKALPLCKRPDCKHNSSECQSYVMGAQMKMYYVDGYIYVFSYAFSTDPVTKSDTFTLWKVAADGTSKEKALKVNDMPANYTIFEGQVYYEFRAENAEGKIVSRILCQPLEGGEEVQIWESSLQNGSVNILQGIGDKVYFYEGGIDISIDMTAPNFDLNEIEEEHNMYTYEPKTGELVKNPEFNGKDGSKIKIRNFYDGKLFYSYWDGIKNEMWYRTIGKEELPV